MRLRRKICANIYPVSQSTPKTIQQNGPMHLPSGHKTSDKIDLGAGEELCYCVLHLTLQSRALYPNYVFRDKGVKRLRRIACNCTVMRVGSNGDSSTKMVGIE